MESMKIVATTILSDEENMVIAEGEHSYLTWHDENAIIDYDYLCEKHAFVKEWVLNTLESNPSHKMSYQVTVIFMYIQIGSTMFGVENHETKQIKKIISNKELSMDENIIDTRGWFLNGYENCDSEKKAI